MERRLACAVIWVLAAKAVLASLVLAGLGGDPPRAVAAEGGGSAAAAEPVASAAPAAVTGVGGEAGIGEDLLRRSRGLRELLRAIGRRQAELDAREQSLARREKDLQLVERRVQAKVARLEALEKRLAARSGPPPAEVLAKIYATMKPEEAAPILDRLEEGAVRKIFRRMKERQVAAILALMDRDRAVTLTRLLAKRR